MPPIASVVPPTSTEVWKLIERDYSLRLSLVTNEWATEHLKAWNAVFAEGRRRGNAAYYGPALVEMEIADVDKRAEWSYRTCCEIWEIQGRTKSRVFFRSVFDLCLQPMFSASEGGFRHGLELHQKRTATRIPQGFSSICGHLKREMGKLRAKWNTKLEIYTRNSDYQQQLAREREAQSQGKMLTIEQVGTIASTFTWKELEVRFREIQVKAAPKQKVSAWFTRTESQSGSVTEEWRVEGNPACRVEFENLASITARKLGYTASENATKYWLGQVREWMQREKLDKNKELAWLPSGYADFEGHRHITQHLFTEKIAELSAMFCIELKTRGTPESAISSPLERTNGKERPQRHAGRKPTRNPEFDRYAGTLWRRHQGSNGRVDDDALKQIADHLDKSPFSKPSDHLEARPAGELRAHNQQFGNSPKKLSTWTDIVTRGKPSLKQGVRRLLSRCARTSAN